MFNKGNTKLRNISNGRQRQVNETWNVRLKQESEETQTQRTMIRKRPHKQILNRNTYSNHIDYENNKLNETRQTH